MLSLIIYNDCRCCPRCVEYSDMLFIEVDIKWLLQSTCDSNVTAGLSPSGQLLTCKLHPHLHQGTPVKWNIKKVCAWRTQSLFCPVLSVYLQGVLVSEETFCHQILINRFSSRSLRWPPDVWFVDWWMLFWAMSFSWHCVEDSGRQHLSRHTAYCGYCKSSKVGLIQNLVFKQGFS